MLSIVWISGEKTDVSDLHKYFPAVPELVQYGNNVGIGRRLAGLLLEISPASGL
jgi:hypothetical protein